MFKQVVLGTVLAFAGSAFANEAPKAAEPPHAEAAKPMEGDKKPKKAAKHKKEKKKKEAAAKAQ